MKKHKVLVLGAGISGLCSAYWLKNQQIDVELIEASAQAGGSMQSVRKSGFLIDFGPNSGLDTTPLIGQLVEELKLQDQIIYANQAAKKRYILQGHRLEALPSGPLSFLSTHLFSTSAKLRLLKEPFIRPLSPGQDISIADFVRHRLGEEFLNNAVDPFISGIYAGNPEKLSVKSAIPKLYALEEKHGSLIRGAIAGAKERKKSKETSKQTARQFSFREGMQTLAKALAAQMETGIRYQTSVKKIERGTSQKYKLTLESAKGLREVEADTVLSTIPAHRLSAAIQNLDESLSQHLNAITYPPVMVLYLAFEKKAIRQALDGFGFLIPGRERRSFLGAIWSSVIFPQRADDQYATFTIFVGGARQQGLLQEDLEDKKKKVIREFKEIMMIADSVEPILAESKLWNNAIPQYNLGYQEHEDYFQRFEVEHPGFFLGGNYRGGISVSDCINTSELNSQRILEYLKRSTKPVV